MSHSNEFLIIVEHKKKHAETTYYDLHKSTISSLINNLNLHNYVTESNNAAHIWMTFLF